MSSEKAVECVIEQHSQSGRYITIDGIRTFYLDHGKGEPVFCIHGVPTSSFLYRKVLRQLETLGLRGVAIDLPGLGLSDRPEDYDYRFSNFALHCEKLLDAINIDHFHLVVHDIGAPVGLALAANNSLRVRSITVLNSMLDIANFKKPLPMRPFETPAIGEAELAMMTHTTWKLMVKYAGIANMNAVPDAEIAAYIELLKREDDGKAFLEIMRSFEQSQAFTRKCYYAVQNERYPVQLVWGMDDPFLTYEEHGVEFERARKPFAILKLKAKHLLQEEQWEAIAEQVRAIVKGSEDLQRGGVSMA